MSGHNSHSYQNIPCLLPSTTARSPTSRCHYYSSKHERADLLLAAPRPCWSSGLAPENARARTSGHRRGESQAQRTRSKWLVQRASYANGDLSDGSGDETPGVPNKRRPPPFAPPKSRLFHRVVFSSMRVDSGVGPGDG